SVSWRQNARGPSCVRIHRRRHARASGVTSTGNGSGRCAGTPTRHGGKPTESAPSAHAGRGPRRVVGETCVRGVSAPDRDGYTENGKARSLPFFRVRPDQTSTSTGTIIGRRR